MEICLYFYSQDKWKESLVGTELKLACISDYKTHDIQFSD